MCLLERGVAEARHRDSMFVARRVADRHRVTLARERHERRERCGRRERQPWLTVERKSVDHVLSGREHADSTHGCRQVQLCCHRIRLRASTALSKQLLVLAKCHWIGGGVRRRQARVLHRHKSHFLEDVVLANDRYHCGHHAVDVVEHRVGGVVMHEAHYVVETRQNRVFRSAAGRSCLDAAVISQK